MGADCCTPAEPELSAELVLGSNMPRSNLREHRNKDTLAERGGSQLGLLLALKINTFLSNTNYFLSINCIIDIYPRNYNWVSGPGPSIK